MTSRVPSRGSDQFNLRFPDGMRDRIKEAAEASGRSMNAEIIARLEASFAPRQPGDEQIAALGERLDDVIRMMTERGLIPPKPGSTSD
ncbi:Arc family DNA-binding protein [Xanthobacter sp. ZOL 2024]